MVRGGKTGNWNVNGWNMILRPILVLDSNEAYTDGKGREYYLNYLVNESTEYHEAVPDIVKTYDPVTGLWPESPGYSFGTVSMLLDFALLLQRAGFDIIADNPILKKAAMAVFPWMDNAGNMVVFGDSRGGAAGFDSFENLLTYYDLIGDRKEIPVIAHAIHTGIATGKYNRAAVSWKGLCLNRASIPEVKEYTPDRTSYSSHHRFIGMKNFGEGGDLMALLYGGKQGYHLSANGLAMQLYGFGYALAPDAAGYESYWSRDHLYHQSATGSNTILPGYEEGEITVNVLEPFIEAGEFTATRALSPWINFADVSAAEKRRALVMVKLPSGGGYYVDIFRSDLEDNDYIYHNVGSSLSLMDKKGDSLRTQPVKSLGKSYHPGYEWFTDPEKMEYEEDLRAVWHIPEADPAISMYMWMPGAKGRTVYRVNAPYTTLVKELTPGNVSMPPGVTPTLIIRQEGNNAWDHPFMAVFEPVQGGQAAVSRVSDRSGGEGYATLSVETREGVIDCIVHSVRDKKIVTEGIAVQGTLGIVRRMEGRSLLLYLCNGTSLDSGDCGIWMEEKGSASIRKEHGEWYYSSTVAATVKMAGKEYQLSPGYDRKLTE
ncbi:MAG: hypothetical protein LUE93_00690 [Bacteroides sp.]|nr:hypothetical protein [Bacteroides sp.]